MQQHACVAVGHHVNHCVDLTADVRWIHPARARRDEGKRQTVPARNLEGVASGLVPFLIATQHGLAQLLVPAVCSHHERIAETASLAARAAQVDATLVSALWREIISDLHIRPRRRLAELHCLGAFALASVLQALARCALADGEERSARLRAPPSELAAPRFSDDVSHFSGRFEVDAARGVGLLDEPGDRLIARQAGQEPVALSCAQSDQRVAWALVLSGQGTRSLPSDDCFGRAAKADLLLLRLLQLCDDVVEPGCRPELVVRLFRLLDEFGGDGKLLGLDHRGRELVFVRRVEATHLCDVHVADDLPTRGQPVPAFEV